MRAVSRVALVLTLCLTPSATGLAAAESDILIRDFEGELGPFLGKPQMEKQQIFSGERFPNVVVAADGTVVAMWGRLGAKARRSENGGKTWGPTIAIAEPRHGGGVSGVIVDETTSDILAFVQDTRPPAPAFFCRSEDHGKTWQKEELIIEKDAKGSLPQLHMAEHGITLRRGKHVGRLLRPARVYGSSSGYNTAIYSDDGGKHWHSSSPFPMNGTGEGALAELTGGQIYYSSRKHWFPEVADFTARRPFAWSHDGGETWTDAGFDEILPDGPRYRGQERRGSNYNGHFGMMCGLTRLPVEGRDILLYSNSDTPDHRRVRMTVWASFDGGKTWPVKRLVYEGPSAYSSLTAGRPGTPSAGWIYLEFEGGEKDKYEGAYLARFNLSWLLEGEKTGDGEVPEWAAK